jgi:transposase InsO family protein
VRGLSDHGTDVKNDLIRAVLTELGITETHGTVHHPQTQGCVERRNGYLKQLVRAAA